MPEEEYIYVGEWGFDIALQLMQADGQPLNLEDSLGIRFIFHLPINDNHITFAKDGQLQTDGTDGWVIYTLQEGDITEAGPWEVQAKVLFTAGVRHSPIIALPVKPSLVEPAD